jgi:hypothetical protein
MTHGSVCFDLHELSEYLNFSWQTQNSSSHDCEGWISSRGRSSEMDQGHLQNSQHKFQWVHAWSSELLSRSTNVAQLCQLQVSIGLITSITWC